MQLDFIGANDRSKWGCKRYEWEVHAVDGWTISHSGVVPRRIRGKRSFPLAGKATSPDVMGVSQRLCSKIWNLPTHRRANGSAAGKAPTRASDETRRLVPTRLDRSPSPDASPLEVVNNCWQFSTPSPDVDKFVPIALEDARKPPHIEDHLATRPVTRRAGSCPGLAGAEPISSYTPRPRNDERAGHTRSATPVAARIEDEMCRYRSATPTRRAAGCPLRSSRPSAQVDNHIDRELGLHGARTPLAEDKRSPASDSSPEEWAQKVPVRNATTDVVLPTSNWRTAPARAVAPAEEALCTSNWRTAPLRAAEEPRISDSSDGPIGKADIRVRRKPVRTTPRAMTQSVASPAPNRVVNPARADRNGDFQFAEVGCENGNVENVVIDVSPRAFQEQPVLTPRRPCGGNDCHYWDDRARFQEQPALTPRRPCGNNRHYWDDQAPRQPARHAAGFPSYPPREKTEAPDYRSASVPAIHRHAGLPSSWECDSWDPSKGGRLRAPGGYEMQKDYVDLDYFTCSPDEMPWEEHNRRFKWLHNNMRAAGLPSGHKMLRRNMRSITPQAPLWARMEATQESPVSFAARGPCAASAANQPVERMVGWADEGLTHTDLSDQASIRSFNNNLGARSRSPTPAGGEWTWCSPRHCSSRQNERDLAHYVTPPRSRQQYPSELYRGARGITMVY